MTGWTQPYTATWIDRLPAGAAEGICRSAFAVRLTGLSPVKETTIEHLLAEQADFIRSLGGQAAGDAGRRIDLRYIGQPAAVDASRRLTVVYVCQCTGDDEGQASARARLYAEDMRLSLPSASGAYSFKPVTVADELAAHLSAEPYCHWAEIRRRITSVQLSRKASTSVLHPFIPRATTDTSLLRALLMLDDYVCLSFRLDLAPDAEQARATVRRAASLCGDARLEDVPREQAMQILANHQYLTYTLQDPALCEMRVRLACNAPIQPGLLNMIGNAITASPGLYAVSGFTVDGGGYCSAIAQTAEAAEVFASDHTNVQCTEWMASGADEEVDCARQLFCAREVACAMHLPWPGVGGCPGVPSVRAKAALALPELPLQGVCLGGTEFGGHCFDVRFQQKDRRRHQYVVGQTGTGKSTLLLSMIKADISAGQGVCVIDPHGDLVDEVLTAIPDERIDDVVLFDPADAEYPMGLNLFEWKVPSQKDFLVQECVHIFYKLFDPHGTGMIGPQFEHWMRNGALTLMSSPEGGTIVEMARLFSDYAGSRRGGGGDFAAAKRSWVTDVAVRDFWRQLDATSDFHISEMLNYFVSKFGRFYGNEMVRNIVGQGRSGFDLREVMDNGKILLVNLSKGLLGEENSKLLGMILTAKIQMAAMSRADTPMATRRDFFLYVDEFQNFTTDSFAAMLSEARKYRIALILANQFVQQLSEHVRDAVFGNAGTFVCFRLGPQDAAIMARQFSPYIEEDDLRRLPNHQSYVKLLVNGYPSDPFLLTNQFAERTTGDEQGSTVRESSRRRLAHPKDQVMLAVEERLTAPKRNSGD